jgi:pSer/pThr/pTyr-binding forkhead associated (FHA) protein
MMHVRLINVTPGTPRGQVVVDHLPVVLGRSPDADVRLEDRWVSRRHCEIDQINGTLTVRDLESRHGTAVNGQYVALAHLMPGDRLTIGLTSLEVRYKRSRPTRPVAVEREIADP